MVAPREARDLPVGEAPPPLGTELLDVARALPDVLPTAPHGAHSGGRSSLFRTSSDRSTLDDHAASRDHMRGTLSLIALNSGAAC